MASIRQMKADRKKRINRRKDRSQLIGDGEGEKQVGYVHPAHPHLLVAITRSSGWHCDVCMYQWTLDGEHRPRYRCRQEHCEFNVCGDCMSAEYSAWHAQKDKFLAGGSIAFPGLLFMGTLPMVSGFPSPDDREALLEIIDNARREGDLPWRGKESRQVQFFPDHISIATDPTQAHEWERYSEARVFITIPLREVSHVAYLDDDPCHVVVIARGKAPDGSCHFFQAGSAELAEGVCQASYHVFDFMYTQAILNCVDDSIFAGLEGRPTAVEQQATEEANIKKAQAAQSKKRDSEQLGVVEDEEDNERKRATVFELFGLGATSAAQPATRKTPSPLPPAARRDLTPSPAVQKMHNHTPSPATGRTTPASPLHRQSPGPGTPTMGSPGTVDPSSLPDSAVEVVQGYMRRLQNLLTTAELKTFAQVLREYRTQGNFTQFWKALVDLYKPSRNFLLAGMESFVPAHDKPKFYEELAKQPVTVGGTPIESGTPRGGTPRTGTPQPPPPPAQPDELGPADLPSPPPAAPAAPAQPTCPKCKKVFPSQMLLSGHKCRK